MSAGNYLVTVTDANDCTAVALASITEPTALVVLQVQTNTESCMGASDGSATVQVVGGVPPYTFNWSAAGSGPSISGLAAGSYQVTVTDDNGATAVAPFVIPTAPTLTLSALSNQVVCPGGTVAATALSALPGALVLDYSWTATGSLPFGTYADGNASGANPQIPSFTASATPGSITVTVTGTYTTASGSCQDDVVFTVTAQDIVDPTFLNCPAPIVVSNDVDQCGAVVSWNTPIAVDDCSGLQLTVTQTAGSTSGSFFPVSAVPELIAFTATDAGGNTVTCSFTVQVLDNQRPDITCPLAVSVSTDPGNCTALVDAGSLQPVAQSDNCPNPTLSWVLSGATTGSGSGTPTAVAFNLGVTLVTYTLLEQGGTAGNPVDTRTCAFTVAVADQELPVIDCSNFTNTQRNVAVGNCTYTVQGAEFNPAGATDNCSGVALTNNYNQTASLTGAAFPVGVTEVVWTATDAAGNTATCVVAIDIRDPHPPVINCAGVTTSLNNTPGACGFQVSNNALNPSFNDNCSATRRHNFTSAPQLNTLNGAFLPVGSTTVVWTITDASGNTATCSVTYTVTDNEQPTADCIAQKDVVLGANGTAQVSVADVLISALDNCGATTAAISRDGVTFGDVIDVSCADLPGTVVCTLRITDAYGNSRECLTILNVVDQDAPQITCPNPVTVQADAGLCVAQVSGIDPQFQSDNCPATLSYTLSNATMGSGTGSASGLTFNGGSTLVSYFLRDGSGNERACFFSVTVVDAQAPTLDCTNIQPNVDTDPDVCTYTVQGNAMNPASFDDNCPGATLSNSLNGSNTLNGYVFSQGATTVVWTVTDASGNSSSCSVVVNVSDRQLPVVDCANIPLSFAANTDSCSYAVGSTALDPVFGDNCSATQAHNFIFAPQTHTMQGAVLPKGATVVVWTVTDASGNSATCSVTYVVADGQPPVFLNCPASMIMIGNDPNQCSGKLNWSIPVAVDNCGQTVQVQQVGGPLPGSVVPVTCPASTQTITYRATDTNGNTTDCAFEIMVTDTERPVYDADIVMPANVTVSCDAIPAPFVLTNSDVNDNCTTPADLIVRYDTVSTQGSDPAACNFYNYQVTRTWTVTDCAGNARVHNQVVTVQDVTKPNAQCQDITVTLDKFGVVSITPGQVNNGSTDKCAPPAHLDLALSKTTFNCSNLGNNTVVLTVTDPCLNASTCSATVTVQEGLGKCTPVFDLPGSVLSGCLNNATTLTNGQFQDRLQIHALAGQTWTVQSSVNFFTTTSQAPPFSPTAMPNGTPLVMGSADGVDNNGDGVTDEAEEMVFYTLEGRHVDGLGYTVTLVNDLGQTLTISNKSYYPTPEFLNLDGPYCLKTPPFTITVGEAYGAAGTVTSITINGVPSSTFNAQQLGIGAHTVVATFDAGAAQPFVTVDGTVVAGSDSAALANPGCQQRISKTVQVVGTPTTVVCNNLVNISLDQSCTYTLNADDVLQGTYFCYDDYKVELDRIAPFNNGPWQPGVLVASDIGKTFGYRVTHDILGNMCWGSIRVEDKLAPALVCPPDVTIACSASTDEGVTGTVQITDCSATTTQIHNKFTDFGDCADPRAQLMRTWIVTDVWGNQSSCSHTITISTFNLADVSFPQDLVIDCEDAKANPAAVLPDATGRPHINGFPIGSGGLCSASINYTDEVFDVCAGSYEILRTWRVRNTCLPVSATNPATHVQVIMVKDQSGPTFDCPADLTVSTDPSTCCATAALPSTIISEGCSGIKSLMAKVKTTDPNSGAITTFVVPGSLADFPGNNPWDPDTLAVFGFTQCLPIGVYSVEYIAEDFCGNISSCSFELTVEDLVPPTAVCDEFTVVSLGSSGVSLVNALTFDDGSYDQCNPVYFKVRRVEDGPCDNDDDVDLFDDQVAFCCADINGTIEVILRVYDVPVPSGTVEDDFAEGRYNDCVVQVTVEDKIRPVCLPPANVTVSCENFDPSLWAYGTANAVDNCCLDTITTVVFLNQFDTVCNKGTITRRFTAVDCGGQQTQCSQRIVVNYNQSYSIRFPNDVVVNACSGSGDYGQPTFLGEDCELLAVSYTDLVFNQPQGACFRIDRTWKVINWCQYDPNGPTITVPNPQPNAALNDPSNLPGPVVSPLGTLPPWAPTVVKINASDAQATNYSTFWSANANSYTYTQIILVIDSEKPVVSNCPVESEICDLTNNDDALWNNMVWWDPTTQSHDLAEAPSDITITATDSCTGPSLSFRYLLFLDLDQDGVMETVVSSTNPPTPGTVNFNNANTPNYTGGVVQSFDGRPVLSLQKYRFSLQQTIVGNAQTARVAWNTLQSPNVFTEPQLPPGRHKIKWFVQDGCGNETVCEYEIVIKDCKAPTLVCEKKTANLMATGMVMLWASDFLSYGVDNITPANRLEYSVQRPGLGSTFPVDALGFPINTITFTCAEVGAREVELWVRDLAGNADYCVTELEVQDNSGVCLPPGSSATVAGILSTESQVGVQNAQVSMNGQMPNASSFSYNDQTDPNGVFSFQQMVPVGAGYTITPVKDDNPLNGVSTYDLVLISKHILGLEPLVSPYKMIAADANKSGSITTFDIVELRKLILGIYDELPNNTSWRFISEDFQFPNQSNPFATAFPEVKTMPHVGGNVLSEDFVAIKVGDVNGSALPNTLVSADDRAAGLLLFDVEDLEVAAGTDVTVSFTAGAFVEGYQFTLNLKGLTVEEIIPGEGLTAENFAVFKDAITTSAMQTKGVFSVRFRATQSGRLSNLIGVSSRITKAEAYSKEGETMGVALRFGSDKVVGMGFEVYQNQPNPWIDQTTIRFHLPEATSATLTIFDETGRLLFSQTGEFGAGYNAFVLDRSLMNTSGVQFYKVETSTDSEVKTMVQMK